MKILHFFLLIPVEISIFAAIKLPFNSDIPLDMYKPEDEELSCDMKCEGDQSSKEHIVCKCYGENNGTYVCRTGLRDYWMEFRHFVMLFINSQREKLASQKMSSASFNEPVADMNAISYSLPLEYVARCLANLCTTEINKEQMCLQTKMFKNVKHWVVAITRPMVYIPHKEALNNAKTELEENVKKAAQTLEISTKDGNKYGTFSSNYDQVIFWAGATHVGCFIKYKTFKTMKDNEVQHNYKAFMVCNFAATKPEGKNDKLFEVGDPCSKCPNKTKSNLDFNSLCGEIELIPTRELVSFKQINRGTNAFINPAALCFCIVLCFI